MKHRAPTCRDIARHICEELDGRISSRECREIRRHLEKCRNCTAYLDSLKKTVRMYRIVPTPRPTAKRRRQLFMSLSLEIGKRPASR